MIALATILTAAAVFAVLRATERLVERAIVRRRRRRGEALVKSIAVSIAEGLRNIRVVGEPRPPDAPDNEALEGAARRRVARLAHIIDPEGC